MRRLAKLTWVELKLFSREPITLVFTFAFPVIVLFAMGEVFGNNPSSEGFGGLGPMDYYVPAYIGVVMAAIGLISLPVHLVGYRERGVLRRLRASSVPVWNILGAQVVVSFAVAVLCTILLTVPALLAYDVHFPESAGLLGAAFVLSLLAFAALGVLLGAVLPTVRAAQGVGMLLFFVMFIISGTAPPREVMTPTMQGVGAAMPLWHMAILLQDAWNGLGWNIIASLIVAGVIVAAAVLSFRFFRWE